jgi:hypothetical protein
MSAREIDGERCNFVDCDDIIDHSYRLYWIHFRGLDQPLFCYQRLYKDDLLVNVKRSMERILLLGDLDDTGSYVDHELSIDDTDLVKPPQSERNVVESCETAVREILGRLPSLANITQASIEVFCEHDVKEVISRITETESTRYQRYCTKGFQPHR